MSETIFDMLPDGGREVKQSVAEVGAFIAAPTAVGERLWAALFLWRELR